MVPQINPNKYDSPKPENVENNFLIKGRDFLRNIWLGLWKLFLVKKKMGNNFEGPGNQLDFEGKYLHNPGEGSELQLTHIHNPNHFRRNSIW